MISLSPFRTRRVVPGPGSCRPNSGASNVEACRCLFGRLRGADAPGIAVPCSLLLALGDDFPRAGEELLSAIVPRGSLDGKVVDASIELLQVRQAVRRQLGQPRSLADCLQANRRTPLALPAELRLRVFAGLPRVEAAVDNAAILHGESRAATRPHGGDSGPEVHVKCNDCWLLVRVPNDLQVRRQAMAAGRACQLPAKSIIRSLNGNRRTDFDADTPLLLAHSWEPGRDDDDDGPCCSGCKLHAYMRQLPHRRRVMHRQSVDRHLRCTYCAGCTSSGASPMHRALDVGRLPAAQQS